MPQYACFCVRVPVCLDSPCPYVVYVSERLGFSVCSVSWSLLIEQDQAQLQRLDEQFVAGDASVANSRLFNCVYFRCVCVCVCVCARARV